MKKIRDPETLDEIFAPEPTKSQLTDIWKQANRTAGPAKQSVKTLKPQFTKDKQGRFTGSRAGDGSRAVSGSSGSGSAGSGKVGTVVSKKRYTQETVSGLPGIKRAGEIAKRITEEDAKIMFDFLDVIDKKMKTDKNTTGIIKQRAQKLADAMNVPESLGTDRTLANFFRAVLKKSPR